MHKYHQGTFFIIKNLLQIVILASAMALKFSRRPQSLLATAVAARLAVGFIAALVADSA